MKTMSDDEMKKIASEAINAANKVFFEAGITDRLVAQLGFIEAAAARENNAKSRIFDTWSCDCWDCVTGGVGPCICNGPACDLFPD